MHIANLEFQAAWRILVYGLILGAGLPTLFALGIRSLAAGQGGDAEISGSTGSAGPAANPLGTALAVLCFAIVLAAVALGITYIVVTGQGKVLNFDHVYPVIQAKKH